MHSYHVIQRGPVFERDMEATLERTSGSYRVKTRDHDDGEEEEMQGTLELPADVYNGMILTVLKNFEKALVEAFTLSLSRRSPRSLNSRFTLRVVKKYPLPIQPGRQTGTFSIPIWGP